VSVAGAGPSGPQVRAITGSRDRAAIETTGIIFGDDRRRWGIDAYKNIGWVYSCVSRIAKDLARLPWTVRRGPKAADPEAPETNELTKLLTRPNPRQSFQDWMNALVINLLTTGSAPNLLETLTVNKLGAVKEVWNLNPLKLGVVLNEADIISAWKYTNASGLEKTWPAEAIAFFYLHDPEMPIGGGMSPQTPIMTQLNTMYKANRWNARFFTKGARPSAVAETDEDLPQASFDRLKQQIEAEAAGEEKAWTILLFDNGVKLKPWESSHKDMGFPEMMRMIREEILSVNATPPGLAGDFKEATYAQVEMQDRWYWENTIKPLVGHIEGVINSSIATRIAPGPDPRFPALYWRYTLNDVPALQEDQTAKVARDVQLVSYGLRTPNEILEEDGREPYEGGDTHFMSSSLKPIDDMLDPPDPPPMMLPPGATPPGQEDGEAEDDSTNEDGEEDTAGQERAMANPSRPSVQRAARSLLADVNYRAARWNDFEFELQAAERALSSFWNSFLREIGRYVNKRVKQYPPTADIGMAEGGKPSGQFPHDASFYLPDVNDLVAEAVEGHGRIYQRLVNRFGREAAEKVSELVNQKLDFDAGDPGVLRVIERDSERVAQSVTKLHDELRNIVHKGLKEGESIDAVTKRIARKVGPGRAGRIVRTEAHAASQDGTAESFRQCGIEQKMWLSQRDNRVRDTHREADGQVRKMNEPFEVGGYEMDRPGDPAGPPEEVCECRCSMLPVPSDEGGI
jgi:HK97 family phage portal protein